MKKTNRPVDPGPPPKPPDGPPRSKIDKTELWIVSIGLAFLILLSLYNLSKEGYLGLSEKTWKGIWVFAENGILIYIFLLASLLTGGIVKRIFRWVFVPYFVLRLVYYLCCYIGIFVFSNKVWDSIWSIVLVASIIVSLGIVLIRNRYA